MKPQQPVRHGANAGANSSKVEIPWKIGRGSDRKSPFLSAKRGLFFTRRGKVEPMKAAQADDDMGDGMREILRTNQFNEPLHGKDVREEQ
jgi:hypothetical protein